MAAARSILILRNSERNEKAKAVTSKLHLAIDIGTFELALDCFEYIDVALDDRHASFVYFVDPRDLKLLPSLLANRKM